MKFIFAAANLRMHVFSILPLISYHDCKVILTLPLLSLLRIKGIVLTRKGIAGNIVPAISTTNAIVAGIQVLQAIKIITSTGE